MERATARRAGRCDNETSIRPHHCAACRGNCATMRLNRCFAAVTARTSHARATHARASFRPARGTRERFEC
eukprot:812455-Lingulodinium_polyedra.AAC.1